MFKSATARAGREPIAKGDESRERILDAALESFRAEGFERTTLRQIARRSGLALGAAYYYFPSKEALVHAYYARVQAAHRELVASLPESMDLRERLEAALLAKLDLLANDRALLGALFKSVGTPGDPSSPFGRATRDQREQAISTFADALRGKVPDELLPAVSRAVWALHLALLLYWLHDQSRGQRRTRRLVVSVSSLVASALALATTPGGALLLVPVLDVLHEAGLVPPPKRGGHG